MKFEDIKTNNLYRTNSNEDEVFVYVKKKYEDYILVTFLRFNYTTNECYINMSRKLTINTLESEKMIYRRLDKSMNYKSFFRSIFNNSGIEVVHGI